MAQGTVIPLAIQIATDLDNRVVAGALASFTAAGTDDPIAVFADVELTTALEQPVEASAAGRFPQMFAAPGVAYDLNITTPGGVSIPGYPAVNLVSVPLSEHPTSVTGTAGETLGAFHTVYLSDGQGGKTAGLWYLADTTYAYASSLPEIGVVTATIVAGQSGTIQVGGRVAIPGVTPGASYYTSAAPGQLTTVPGAYPRYIGQADSTASVVLSPNPPLKTGGFASYSVAWTGGSPAIGNGGLLGAYLQIGRLVTMKLNFTAGSTTVFGSGGTWEFSLPVPSSVFTNPGVARMFDVSTNKNYSGVVIQSATNRVTVLFDNSVVLLTTTMPFTWADGDGMQMTLTYEAA